MSGRAQGLSKTPEADEALSYGVVTQTAQLLLICKVFGNLLVCMCRLLVVACRKLGLVILAPSPLHHYRTNYITLKVIISFWW